VTLDVVCDNTDLTAIWGAEAPDILVVGAEPPTAIAKVPTARSPTGRATR
jgi:hypothetical protein